MPSKQDIYLPPGVTPKDELDNKKHEKTKGTIRYPNKEFYSKFYAVCEKAKVSMNEVLVGFAADFTKRNEFLLEKSKK